MINIADVRVNGGTQSRAALNLDVVSDYADLVRAGVDFPAIVVFFDGKNYWLADGFHRYEAYSRAGAYEIAADIRQGTQRDAILHSVGANAEHGLRRTNDDKHRAVGVLLADAEWSAWSNREIARQCGVSEGFVRSQRNPICVPNADSVPRTVTRNGTTYQQNTANIGAASKPDQDPHPQQNNVVSLQSQPEKVEQSKPEQEHADDPATAKLRRELNGLTREALLDDLIAVKLARADDAAKIRTLKAEIETLKADLAAYRQDDMGRALGNAQRQARTAEGRMAEYQTTAVRADRKAKILEAENKKLRAELENQVIPL